MTVTPLTRSRMAKYDARTLVSIVTAGSAPKVRSAAKPALASAISGGRPSLS